MTTITPPSFDSIITDPVVATESVDAIEVTSLVQNIIFSNGWNTIAGFSFILSMGIVVAIIYAMMRVKQIRALEENHYKHQPMTVEGRKTFGKEDAPAAGAAGEARWREVMRHIQSEDANGWRQAIMEADIMLDDVVTNLGYTGDGVGEKMKQIARSDVNTIDEKKTLVIFLGQKKYKKTAINP